MAFFLQLPMITPSSTTLNLQLLLQPWKKERLARTFSHNCAYPCCRSSKSPAFICPSIAKAPPRRFSWQMVLNEGLNFYLWFFYAREAAPAHFRRKKIAIGGTARGRKHPAGRKRELLSTLLSPVSYVGAILKVLRGQTYWLSLSGKYGKEKEPFSRLSRKHEKFFGLNHLQDVWKWRFRLSFMSIVIICQLSCNVNCQFENTLMLKYVGGVYNNKLEGKLLYVWIYGRWLPSSYPHTDIRVDKHFYRIDFIQLIHEINEWSVHSLSNDWSRVQVLPFICYNWKFKNVYSTTTMFQSTIIYRGTNRDIHKKSRSGINRSLELFELFSI